MQNRMHSQSQRAKRSQEKCVDPICHWSLLGLIRHTGVSKGWNGDVVGIKEHVRYMRRLVVWQAQRHHECVDTPQKKAIARIDRSCFWGRRIIP